MEIRQKMIVIYTCKISTGLFLYSTAMTIEVNSLIKTRCYESILLYEEQLSLENGLKKVVIIIFKCFKCTFQIFKSRIH